MEGFSYVDIFATKGIEYLLVIGFLLLFTFFWRFLSRPAKRVFEVAEKFIPVVNEWFRLPEEIYYHLGTAGQPRGEEFGEGGDKRFRPETCRENQCDSVAGIGSTVNQGGKGWALEVDSKTIDMLSPVDGKVVAINEKIVHSPEDINKYPYVSWLMKVESPRFSANKKQLLSGHGQNGWRR